MIGCSVVVLLLAATSPTSIKLASPGLSSVNVTTEVQSFVTDHLNQKLVLAGLDVLSSSQVAAVLGLERQRQLLGCNAESECLAEFANALGVDGLLLGSVARFGTTLQLDVRVAAATDARNLATVSIRIPDETGLLDAISQAATAIARQLSETLKVTLKPLAVAEATITPSATRYSTFRTAGMWTFIASSAAFVGGLIALGATAPPETMPVTPPSSAFGAALGVSFVGLGGMLIGGLIWLVGGNEQVPIKASLSPSRDGFTFALTGSF